MRYPEHVPPALALITSPWRNVGLKGGDIPGRIITVVLLAILVFLVLPPAGVPFNVIKITALICSQVGIVFMMLGLYLSRKTHFAGIILIPAPLIMMWLAGMGAAWISVVLGAGFIGQALLNIITGRCGINRLIGINSCKS